MDNVKVVDNIVWKQERHTKLGLASISISQMEDLFEAVVKIEYNAVMFKAEGIFSTLKEAFFWSYGVKQSMNDDFAGFQRQGENLVETKPKKNCLPEIIPIKKGLEQAQNTYNNFELGKSSTSKGDTISVSQVKTSSLSVEDQNTLLSLMAKAKGKVVTNA